MPIRHSIQLLEVCCTLKTMQYIGIHLEYAVDHRLLHLCTDGSCQCRSLHPSMQQYALVHREYALVCRASMQLSAVSMHRQQSRVCSAQCTGCCPPQRLIMIHGRNGAGRNLIKIFPSTGKTRQHTLRSVALHTFVNLCQPKLSSIPNNCMFG